MVLDCFCSLFFSEFTSCSVILFVCYTCLLFKRSTDVSFIMMPGFEDPTSPALLPDNTSDCVQM